MTVTAVWSGEHAHHDPSGEVWIGIPIVGDETPPRGEVMREVITDLGLGTSEASTHGVEPIHAVHDPAMVAYLETAHEEWVRAGYPRNHGQDMVVPYVFPHPDALAGLGRRWPESRAARAGVFCMDTTTVVGPGTYRAARSAVDCSLTAADLVLEGAPIAYAAVRPPGHHAGTTYFGGSCYMNNAAITAQYLAGLTDSRVAILDIDAHHGNGTQQIFYERDDVCYVSVHIDPGAGWFPHFIGFADETGSGPGEGANHNILLSPGAGDREFETALDRACGAVEAHDAETLVVSLGLDMATADENSPLNVSTRGFARAGDMIRGLGMPTVLVQEGGYDLPSLKADLAAILSRLSSAGGADHGLESLDGPG